MIYNYGRRERRPYALIERSKMSDIAFATTPQRIGQHHLVHFKTWGSGGKEAKESVRIDIRMNLPDEAKGDLAGLSWALNF